ncbi:MAG: peptide-methionine (S)-S-oxide reductase MsrA [Candidatus Methylacidiphilales bacterium]|nr:peptide-methionine (S)-S-oxide reductase MsrA [Candidatus Methylacidiphilales bacterium]
MNRRSTLATLALTLSFSVFMNTPIPASTPAPSSTSPSPTPAQAQAVIGGGCFWCVEAVYERVPGILSAESGYAGGTSVNPTYEEVSSGHGGHAEVVRLTYDPAKISYRKILDLFWEAHDPTTLNRQGADSGPQYRSIILFGNEAEQKEAEASKAAAQAKFKSPIVTEIVPLKTYYPAEKYHQDYYSNVGMRNPYNMVVIAPKLDKLEKKGLIPQKKP